MEQRKRVSALHSDCIPCSFSEGIPVLMSHHSSTLLSPWLTTHPAPARRTPGRVASPAPSHPIWRDTRPPTAPRSSRLPKRRHYAWRGFGQRKKTHAANSPSLAQAFTEVFLSRPPGRANRRAPSPHPLLTQASREFLEGSSAAGAVATRSRNAGRAALGWAARGTRAPADRKSVV